jgi:hypothetical protein
MPSYVEVWGLSITESMMRGKVCITSNTSSMIEAASGIAPLFDPYNVRELADMMSNLYYDGGLEIYYNKLKDYIPIHCRESAKQFNSKVAEMHKYHRSSEASKKPNVNSTRIFAPQKNDKKDAKCEWIWDPTSEKNCLAGQGCWTYVSNQDCFPRPYLRTPWIMVSAKPVQCIAKVMLVDYSDGSQMPALRIYEEGNLVSETQTVSHLPNNEYIVYTLVRGSSQNICDRSLKIEFSDNSNLELIANARQAKRIAPSNWFALKKVILTYTHNINLD